VSPRVGTGVLRGDRDVLGGVGAVVHEQQLDVLDVADKEGLVARGHHEAGLLVGAEADLQSFPSVSKSPNSSPSHIVLISRNRKGKVNVPRA
jgi:hypothetical protein